MDVVVQGSYADQVLAVGYPMGASMVMNMPVSYKTRQNR